MARKRPATAKKAKAITAKKAARLIEKNALAVVDAMDKALFLIMVDLVINKTLPITPIEFGVLRQSAFVNKAKNGEVKGGFSANYASVVHERVFSSRGRKVFHNPPTQAKFLETKFNELKPKFAALLAEETAKQWRKMVVR